MFVGVISDTHDRLPAIDRALALFERRNVQAVIHTGDVVAPFAARRLLVWTGSLYITYGNNDGERAGLKGVLPQIVDGPLSVELGGRRILVHHFVEEPLAELGRRHGRVAVSAGAAPLPRPR